MSEHYQKVIFILAGQSIANRVTDQIKRVTKALRASVQLYNNCSSRVGNGSFPDTVAYEDVCLPTSQLFTHLENLVRI